ncbi:MAG: signal recognition particle-docking protein FtsY [Candidatus Ancillula sp.]|jgi:fused signal recognition particle receptor|nr:signal recognition particle-docking protein FtsY [Candidatus Ancillula sp.]
MDNMVLIWVAAIVIAVVVALVVVNKSHKSAGADKEALKVVDKMKAQKLKKSGQLADRLYELDLGSALAERVVTHVNQGERVEAVLEGMIPKGELKSSKKPTAIMFVGVNGVGKTTTVGKIANLLAKEGNSVVLAAADTFRAAASEQLEVWKNRANSKSKGSVELVTAEKEGQDPASVAFKASEVAVSSGADFLLIDTAGRQQTSKNLMDELAKIQRVVEKNTAIDEVLLVIDSTSGQIALQQAEKFNEIVNVSALVVTKLDGSTKGGILIAVADRLKVPVYFIGVGEGVDDIEHFDAKKFVEGL